ncbi:hypothetical protein BDV96DRAFT_643902 [Lophiotrema nucula]|uniref:NB-ARC domain-containing protein n=1 Tax=Lophiotrema nucula TaxID=690887 RepID=A0A6A5ZDC4_9PLEO|nr:hypothetical protein BDV96DRAFT_643902 [Lophiotrema nucula]
MTDTVGLVAAVIQLGDFTLRVIDRIDDLKAQLNDVPKLLLPIMVEMDLNRDLVGQLDKVAIDNTGYGDKVDALLESFNELLNDLEDTLKRIRIDSTGSFLASIRRVIYSIRNDDKMQRLIGNLRSHANNLRFIVSQLRREPIAASMRSKRYQTGAVRFPVAHFIGREKTIADIEEHFRTCVTKRARVVIQGMGGQGKTQLALEVARQLYDQNHVRSVLWVDATSASSLSKSFEAICDSIHYQRPLPAEPSARLPAAKEIMETWSDPWLLVFDNYDDPSQFSSLLTCLPYSTHAKVLITTRCLQVESLSTMFMPLSGLDEDSAISLLFRHCKVEESNITREYAQSIVRRLAYLPLAIVQAGAYCLKYQLCLSRFLGDFEKKKEAILKYAPEVWEYTKLPDGALNSSAMTVFTTWEMSLEHVDPNSEYRKLARDFLSTCAFLDHQRISELVLRHKIPEDAARLHGDCTWQQLFSDSDQALVWNSIKFEDFIHRLSQLSLVNRSQEYGAICFSIHPLVAEWLRSTCDAEQEGYRRPVLRSIQLVAATLQKQIHKCFSFYEQTFTSDEKQELMAHMMACEERLTTSNPDGYPMTLGRHPLIDVGFFFAVFYNETWLSRKANSLCEAVIASRSIINGEEDVSVWDARSFHGKVTSTVGHFQEARAIHEAVHAYRLDKYGKRDPRIILSEINSKINTDTWIGSNYILDKMWELVHDDSFKNYFVEYPWEVPGRRIFFQYLKCLDMFEELDSEFNIYPTRFCFHKFDTDYGLWINVTNGVVWRKKGYTNTSVTVLRDTVQVFKKMYGPEHRHTLDILGTYAKSLEETRLPAEISAAELIHRNILNTYLTNSSHIDLERLNTRIDIAWNLHLQGRNTEAVYYLDDDTAAYASSQFCTMPLFRKACRMYVTILLASGHFDRVEAWIKECEKLQDQDSMEQYFDILEMRATLEICISKAPLGISQCHCRHEQALQLGSLLEQSYMAVRSDVHKNTPKSLRGFRRVVLFMRICRSYAGFQESRGDQLEAIATWNSAVQVCSDWFEESDIWSIEVFLELAACKQRSDRSLRGMSERLGELLGKLVEMKGDLHPMVIQAKALLTTAYDEEQRLEKATHLREEIVNDTSKIYGSTHRLTQQARLEYAAFLHRTNPAKCDEAMHSLMSIYSTTCNSNDLTDLKLGLACLVKREEAFQKTKARTDLKKTRFLLVNLRRKIADVERGVRDIEHEAAVPLQIRTPREVMGDEGGD